MKQFRAEVSSTATNQRAARNQERRSFQAGKQGKAQLLVGAPGVC